MAEPGTLEDPTLDIKDFEEGDFVKFFRQDTEPSIAVVVYVGNDLLNLKHFEDGFPYNVAKTPSYGGVEKVTKNEALEHFFSISNKLERGVAEGGLLGVIHARKNYHLKGVLEILQSNEVDPYTAVTTDIESPKTGLYALMGVYSGHGPSDHLEGLAVTPRLSENEVSEVIIKEKPKGFGDIPSDIYDTPATSHGSLVAMRSYEVPEEVRELVSNPRKLKAVGSAWEFS
jgi:hypothetical protein